MRTYGTAALHDGRWLIQCEPHVMIRLKRHFGRIEKTKTGAVLIADTPEVARDLEWFTSRFPLVVTPPEHLEVRSLAHKIREEDIEEILQGRHRSLGGLKLALQLREYQQTAAALLLRAGRLLLADDVGLGKTAVGIGTFTDPRTLPALVVTLTHLPRQWQDEIAKFAPSLRTHILKGTRPYDLTGASAGRRRKRERGQAEIAGAEASWPDVIITSYSKLEGWSDVLAGKVKSVIFDETQELRHAKSGREPVRKYVAAQHIAGRASFRLGLSATPIYNYGSEFFNVLDVLAPGDLGQRDEFVREWCGPDNGKASIKDPRAFGAMLRDSGLMLRRTRADVGRELPPLTKVTHHVDADSEALDAIGNDVAELARVILRGGGERGDAMKAGGEIDWMLRQATGIAKAPHVAAFVRLLVENGERVVLYGWHHACFARGTLARMFDGSTKAVEDVAIGDLVMGPDSTPRRVLKLARGHGRMWKVIPTKGEPWVCSDDHLLSLRCKVKNRRPLVTMTAGEFATLPPRSQRNFTLYRAAAVRFPSQPLPFEPWLMGLWLGDGTSSLEGGPGFSVGTADPEISDELKVIADRYGLGLRLHPTHSERCFFYNFTSGKGRYGRNKILRTFKSLGLHKNKHIPAVYKTATISSRREVLAGLIDSDGHIHHGNGAGSATIGQRNERLANDIAELARSIGLAAYVSPTVTVKGSGYGSGGVVHHRVNISGDLRPIPTRVARKRAPERLNRKDVLNVGLKLEELPSDDFFGFELDGDRLFLLDDYTVVHNCYDIWREKLADLHPVLFTGQESIAQKLEAKQAFIAGDSPVLIMSLRAGAGLDGLQGKARIVVFGELDWSPGVHEQAIGRVHRDGQTEQVTAYFMVSDEGSDPIVAQVLGLKRVQIEGVRDPNLALVERLDTGGGHIRKLAEDVLRRRGERLP